MCRSSRLLICAFQWNPAHFRLIPHAGVQSIWWLQFVWNPEILNWILEFESQFLWIWEAILESSTMAETLKRRIQSTPSTLGSSNSDDPVQKRSGLKGKSYSSRFAGLRSSESEHFKNSAANSIKLCGKVLKLFFQKFSLLFRETFERFECVLEYFSTNAHHTNWPYWSGRLRGSNVS